MKRSYFVAALVGALVGSGVSGASAQSRYVPIPQGSPQHAASHGIQGHAPARPLPPVSGTLHRGPGGYYGDRSFNSAHYAGSGAAVYDLRHGEGRRIDHHGRRVAGYGGGYGADLGFAGGYDVGGGYDGAPGLGPDAPDAGVPAYAGQGFVPVAGRRCGGCGPVTYQSTGYGYADGPGGGLGVYIPGAFGPGPRIISIPDHYNVGYGHHACVCGATGLFGNMTD